MQPRAIIIEDAPEFAVMAQRVLSDAGYDVHAVETGEDGLAAVQHLGPELVVVDLGLPGLDGLEVCRRVRSFSDAYIVVVTGRDTEDEKIAGFTAGADDYLTKPYYPGELAARIEAMRRRPRTVRQEQDVRVFGTLHIDRTARIVRLAETVLPLTRTEYEILDRLTEVPGATVSRTQLNQHVWGGTPMGSSVLDVHVGNLRKKLGEPHRNPRLVLSVRGVGFRFEPEAATS